MVSHVYSGEEWFHQYGAHSLEKRGGRHGCLCTWRSSTVLSHARDPASEAGVPVRYRRGLCHSRVGADLDVPVCRVLLRLLLTSLLTGPGREHLHSFDEARSTLGAEAHLALTTQAGSTVTSADILDGLSQLQPVASIEVTPEPSLGWFARKLWRAPHTGCKLWSCSTKRAAGSGAQDARGTSAWRSPTSLRKALTRVTFGALY